MPKDEMGVTPGRTVLGAPSLSVNPPAKEQEEKQAQEQEKTTRLPSRSKASPQPEAPETQDDKASNQDDD
jgi:hypothetical protein